MTSLNGSGQPLSGPLSALEEETIELVAQGLQLKEIGAQQIKSVRMVEDTLKRVYTKMGALNRSHAVYLWTKAQPREREPLPETRNSISHRVTIYGPTDAKVYITLGRYNSGNVGELFVNVGKQGSTLRGLLDAWARQTSVSLQWGQPIDDVISKFKGVTFEPNGPTNNKDIQECTSIIDYVVRWMELQEALHGGR